MKLEFLLSCVCYLRDTPVKCKYKAMFTTGRDEIQESIVIKVHEGCSPAPPTVFHTSLSLKKNRTNKQKMKLMDENKMDVRTDGGRPLVISSSLVNTHDQCLTWFVTSSNRRPPRL